MKKARLADQPTYDGNKIPHARTTSWCWDPDSKNYVLVLEDEKGEPIAALSGCLHQWGGLIDDLFTAIASQPGNHGTLQ